MPGETDLCRLLSTMEPQLSDETFVFCTLKCRTTIPDGLVPLMMFQEQEGTTLIVTRPQAESYNLQFEFPCRRITLQVHSALDAVGFLVTITTALAERGMGVNPVAGFYHDHLFIPEGRQDDALQAIAKLVQDARARQEPSNTC